MSDTVEECNGATVESLLLEPTRIYVKPIRRVLGHYRKKQVVHGIAHITGGGLQENLERILPEGRSLTVHESSWDAPPVFSWLQNLGNVADEEMARVFNMGLGLALVVSEHFADSIQKQLDDEGLSNFVVGKIN